MSKRESDEIDYDLLEDELESKYVPLKEKKRKLVYNINVLIFFYFNF
jgi:hypothetical protein